MVTKTQSKNLRAIDYHITDLLHEPKNRLKGIIIDLYDDCQGDICASLLTHIDQVYGAIQHQYPLLLGTSNISAHNIGFAIGNKGTKFEEGTCNMSEVVIRFF